MQEQVITRLELRRGGAPPGRGKGVVLLIHGRRYRDRMFARRMALMTGASRLRLKMPGRVVPHNVVRPLIEYGELGGFLRQCVFAPTDTPLLAKPGVRATLEIPIDGGGGTPRLTVRG